MYLKPIVLAVAAVAISAAACTPTPKPVPAPTQTVTLPPTPAPSVPVQPSASATVNENAYLYVVRTKLPQFQGSDDKVVALGRSVCADFDRGYTLTDEANQLVRLGKGLLTQYNAGTLIGASISGLCPQHNDLIPSS